jgi:hypothetical protein
MAVIDKRGVTRLTLYVPVNLVAALKLACSVAGVTPSRWVEQNLMKDHVLWSYAHKPRFRIKLHGGKSNARRSEGTKAPAKHRRGHGYKIYAVAGRVRGDGKEDVRSGPSD